MGGISGNDTLRANHKGCFRVCTLPNKLTLLLKNRDFSGRHGKIGMLKSFETQTFPSKVPKKFVVFDHEKMATEELVLPGFRPI